jgi:uncharacterized protein YecE (DUF72 family)
MQPATEQNTKQQYDMLQQNVLSSGAVGQTRHIMKYYLGCPMWAHEHWRGSLFDDHCSPSDYLAQYSRYFNAVEGNTTFYADPSPATVSRWQSQAAADFCFTLKIPKLISHQLRGEARAEALNRWQALMAPLQSQIGLCHLQLSGQYLATQDVEFARLLQQLRQFSPVAVEVRHPALFTKGPAEQQLHQLLRESGCERVILDSRALFAQPPQSAALQDAQQKKPRLPVHVCALGPKPMFRFIGVSDLAANRPFYQPWLHKMAQWLAEGRTPYAFFHTEDNHSAPLLARQFACELAELTGVSHPVLQPWPADLAPAQNTLF